MITYLSIINFLLIIAIFVKNNIGDNQIEGILYRDVIEQYNSSTEF